MAKTIKLSDIAEVVGVSTVTVSKALSDKVGVSDEMRQKIKDVAEEMGYVSKSTVKGNVNETNNIGVIVPERYFEVSSFYWTFYHKIVSLLTEQNYFCILEIVSREAELNLEIPKVMQDQKVDGLIFIGQANEDYMEMVVNLETLPMIVLDSYDANIKYDAVVSDGFYGMYMLTNHLLKMGHKEIGFVGTVLATSSITDRYLGYMKALMEHGIQPNPEWIVPDRGENAKMEGIFDLPVNLPTAFACNCDLTAQTVIKKLNDMNLSVPEDISLVGFDNYVVSDLTSFKITTYEVRIDRMVKVCIDNLLKKIRKQDYPEGLSIVSGTVILGDSVKKI